MQYLLHLIVIEQYIVTYLIVGTFKSYNLFSLKIKRILSALTNFIELFKSLFESY